MYSLMLDRFVFFLGHHLKMNIFSNEIVDEFVQPFMRS